MGWMLRTCWNLLQPNIEKTVTTKQANQKGSHDKCARAREFEVGETVMAQNPNPGLPAVAGIVKKRQLI